MTPHISRSIYSGLIVGAIFIVISPLTGISFASSIGLALVLAVGVAVLTFVISPFKAGRRQ